MKKKVIITILSMTLVLGMMSGCGKDEGYEVNLPTEAVEAEIYVEAIPEMSDDFIKGVDISTVLVEEESGVVYYNEAGEEADLFQVLADAGINYIRVRVWNDPYDENGNGYGGGNNDVAKAAEIGKRAAKYGMKLLVDFHYSDFWADPGKQMVPKAWDGMTMTEKKEAIYDYTKESLDTIINAGADVGMVQIGNEINNGMSGEMIWSNRIELLAEASKAVREVADKEKQDVQVAVHFTNIEDQNKILTYAKKLADAELDYDVFGVSYYIFWHGTLENLTDTLVKVSDTYGKKVAVLETSYAYTLEDGDGSGNTVDAKVLHEDYAATVQSQANCIRDIMAATVAAGENAIGVFYWEPAWLPVGPANQYEANQKIWEEKGSGWASSFAAGYDPEDAGKYYGGCAWDNQALFDFTGHPLASLNVFKYAKYGTICEVKADYMKPVTIQISVGEAIVLPETVDAVMNNRTSGAVKVIWNQDEVNAIDANRAGSHVINGTLEDGTAVTCALEIAGVNLVANPSFEDADMSMWKVSYEGDKNPTDILTKEADAVTGEKSFHFWSESKQDFSVEQTISGLDAGTYSLKAHFQGGDVGDDAEVTLYAIVKGQRYEAPATLDGWINWQIPIVSGITLDGNSDIIIGAHIKCAAKGWGTIDDFNLFQQ